MEHFGFQDFLSSVKLLFKPIFRTIVRSDIMKIFKHKDQEQGSCFIKVGVDLQQLWICGPPQSKERVHDCHYTLYRW